MFPLTRGTSHSHIHRDRKQNSGFRGRERRKRGVIVQLPRVPVWNDEEVLEMDAGDGAQ